MQAIQMDRAAYRKMCLQLSVLCICVTLMFAKTFARRSRMQVVRRSRERSHPLFEVHPRRPSPFRSPVRRGNFFVVSIITVAHPSFVSSSTAPRACKHCTHILNSNQHTMRSTECRRTARELLAACMCVVGHAVPGSSQDGRIYGNLVRTYRSICYRN